MAELQKRGRDDRTQDERLDDRHDGQLLNEFMEQPNPTKPLLRVVDLPTFVVERVENQDKQTPKEGGS